MSSPYRVKNTFVEHYRYDNERPQRSNSWSRSDSSGKASLSKSSSELAAKLRSSHLESGSSQTRRPDEAHVVFPAQTSSESWSDCSRSAPRVLQRRKGGAGTKVEVEQEVPQERGAQVWSRSDKMLALHEARQCIPCASMEVVKYCKGGDDCKFCHLSHADHKMQRPGKEVRLECKRALRELLLRPFDSERDRVIEVQSFLNRQSPFVRKYTYKLMGDESIVHMCFLDESGCTTIPPEFRAAGTGSALQDGGSSKGGKRGQLTTDPRNLGRERVSL